MEPPSEVAPHPATVTEEPAAGSEPEAGRLTYLMVELVGIVVESLKMAMSLLLPEYAGLRITWETLAVTPPEAQFCNGVNYCS